VLQRVGPRATGGDGRERGCNGQSQDDAAHLASPLHSATIPNCAALGYSGMTDEPSPPPAPIGLPELASWWGGLVRVLQLPEAVDPRGSLVAFDADALPSRPGACSSSIRRPSTLSAANTRTGTASR
jgi:hypothetical protein